ncbi:MAG: lipoprotein insertase outer membrane protein LolB [Pseudomonadota bacterium]
MTLSIHRFYLVLPIIVLSACSTIGHQLSTTNNSITPSSTWDAQKNTADALDAWILRGRLVLSDGHEKNASNLFWKQTTDQYQIQLAGPVGLGRVKLTGDAQHVQVTSSQGKKSFDSLEYAQRYYRLPNIPVNQLHYWVRGLPYPLSPVIGFKQNDNGFPLELTQDQWHVTLSNYRLTNGLTMPSKVALRKQIGTKRLSVSLDILSWTID